MYKIIIVDDEPIEREALRLLIKNNFSSLRIVAEAQNGFEAIQYSRELLPDILIIDIKMPGISGIDAIKEIKKIIPAVKFIILSSYNEFEYAQQSLKLGAEDFIVKPAKMQNMIDTINAVIEKLENEKSKGKLESILKKKVESIRPFVENDLVEAMALGCSREEFERLKGFLEVEFKNAFCLAVSGQNVSDFVLSRIKNVLAEIGVKCIGTVINCNIILYVFYEKDGQQRFSTEIASYLKKIVDWNNGEKLQIGMGESCSENTDFRKSYLEALEALRIAKVSGNDYMHIASCASEFRKSAINIAGWEKKLFERILTGETDNPLNMAEEFFDHVSAESDNELITTKDKIYQAIVLFDKSFMDIFGHYRKSYEVSSILEDINGLSDLKALKHWFLSCLQNYIEEMNDSRNGININSITRNAIDYINRNYCREITLEDVAEKLRISPFYLSKLLKRNTGKNYIDFVTEMRINKSKELLKGSDLSIKEIAFKSGFNSQNYFAKIFRKIVGMTPSEFKNVHYADKQEDKQ